MKTAQRTPHAGARANTLVLVTAILVLLVIIATAFLVRSQSGRAQAAAQQKSVAREARVETMDGGDAVDRGVAVARGAAAACSATSPRGLMAAFGEVDT